MSLSGNVAYRDGGKTGEVGFSRTLSKVLSYNGVIATGDLLVSAQVSPNTTVAVSAGDCLIGQVSPSTSTYSYECFLASGGNLTVGANSSGNPRIDAVVAYVDLSVISTASSENPNAMKVDIVAGTSAGSPVAPTNSAIQTAVGASNPFIVLANIAVANGFSTITASTITDIRTFSGLNLAIAGWSPVSDTWSYSSVSGSTGVLTVPSGSAAKYSTDWRVRFKQSQALNSYWSFDTNSNDSKGSNNGTDTSMTYTAGKFSNAATFNGTTSKIVVADATSLKPTGAFTLGMWFKTSNTGANKILFQSYSANTNGAGFLFYVNSSNHLQADFGSNTAVANTTLLGSVNVCDGNWHHVVLSYQNNYAQIYLDGVLETSGFMLAPAYAATNYVRIGCENISGTDIDRKSVV